MVSSSSIVLFFLIVIVISITTTASIVFVDAASAEWAWTKLWTFSAGTSVFRPNVRPDGFAVAATEYRVTSFNATTGRDNFWSYQGPTEQGTNIGEPVFVGEYVATAMPSVVYVVNVSDGSHVCNWWINADSGDSLSARPVVYKNTFLFGLNNVDQESDGAVHQIDPATCNNVWRVSTPDGNGVYGSLTISEALDVVYWCDLANRIISIPIGAPAEQFHVIPNSCRRQGQMLEKDGVIYTLGPDDSGIVYKILVSSGQKLWQFDTHATSSSYNDFARWDNELVFVITGSNYFGLNIDGHPAIQNWTIDTPMIDAPVVFGDDPEQNAQSNGRFRKFYNQVASSLYSSDHFIVVSPFTGEELWRGYIDGSGVGDGPTFWNGTVLVPDSQGNVMAFAPCAAYDERDCPLACIEMKGGCGCALADETACNSGIVKRRCTWCANQNLCGRREHVDENGVQVPACDCSSYNYDVCIQANANNGCVWCASQSLCSNTNASLKDFNFQCDCRTYTESQCDAAIANGNSCRFCAGSTDRCTAPWDLSCDCLLIPDQVLCDQSNQQVCSWCNNSNTCSPVVPIQNQTVDPTCSCNNFNKSICTGLASSGCAWCSFGGVEVCAESCACSALDQDFCLQVEAQDKGMCHFCADELQACYPKSQPCSCEHLDENSCNLVYQQSGSCGYCSQFQICTNLVNSTGGKIPLAEACKCKNLNQNQCRIAFFNDNQCKYCSAFDSCVDPSQSCSCEVFSVAECATSFKAGACHVCQDQGICTSATLNPNCSCSFYGASACQKIPITQCTYCENTGKCQSNVNAASLKYPPCSCYSYNGDWDTCKTATDCAIYDGVFGVSTIEYITNISDSAVISPDHATRGSPFCAPSSLASQCAPTSCTSIGSNADLCRIAGCRYDSDASTADGHDQCQSASQCFYFFIYTLVPQSWFMLIFGLLKDVVVLVILGATEWIQRSTAKIVQVAKRMIKKMWVGEGARDRLIRDRMHDTVYICDAVARDGGRRKKYAHEDFTNYVLRICDELFCWSSEPTALMKQKLFDAVAFSLITNQRWISTEDDDESSSSESGDDDDDDEPVAQVENEDGGDDGGAALLQGNDGKKKNKKTQETSSSLMKKKTTARKRKLRPQTLERNEPEFFRIVDVVVEARTSYYIFYSHSRSMSKRISSSINLFPDTNTLVFYVAGIIFMFVSSIWSVLRTDRKILNAMGNTCGQNANYTDGNFYPSSSSGNGGDDQSSSSSTATSVNVFFLVAYRFMNASSWATAVLVFVKFVRGLAQSRASQGSLTNLTIEKKIPILTVKYSRAVQGLLGLYAILTMPFALCGLFFGLPSRGWQCGLPILCGAVGILIDYILIRCFTQEADDPFESSEVGDADDVGERLLSNGEKKTNNNYGSTTTTAVEKKQTKKKHSSRLNDDDNNVDSKSDSKTEELVMSPKEKEREGEDGDGGGAAASSSSATTDKNKNQNRKHESSGGDDDDLDHENENDDDEISSTKKQTELYADIHHVQRDLDRQKQEKDSLLRAILFFLLSQELPTVIIALALQLSVNVTSLLQYPNEFDLVGPNANQVFYRDAGGRSTSCTLSLFKGDVAAVMSDLSTFLPFM